MAGNNILTALQRKLSKLHTNIKTPPGLRSLQSEGTTDKNDGKLKFTRSIIGVDENVSDTSMMVKV